MCMNVNLIRRWRNKVTLLQRYVDVRKKLFDKYYSKLNEKQREAVYISDGPLLVLAGAGSGKTTVLVQRIAHLIKYGRAMEITDIPEEKLPEPYIQLLEKVASEVSPDTAMLENALNTFAVDKASPYEILSITFTNKAAKEMKDRLEKTLGSDALAIWAGTFHSVCAKILRIHIDKIGRDSTFTIYDTDDQKKLMNDCIKELELSDKMFPAKSVLSEISRNKEKLIDENMYAASVAVNDIRKNGIARLYKLYENKKRTANAVDFDDIICLTVKLFKECPDVLDKYRRRFKYILVDEYQDTNKAQFVLTSLLCNEQKNIMVVGDDDQSIYKFRGATIENILSFDKNFDKARVVKLEQNYRSTDMIIGAANSVIKNNGGRKGKTLWTQNKGGEKVTVKKCEDQNAEAQYVVDKITELTGDNSYNFGDFAVLYRNNAQSNSLETVFAKSGIPYRILGGTRFYDRKEVKDVVAYLCVIANANDKVRLKRIINTPKRGIGDATIDEVDRISIDENKDMLWVCRNAAMFPSLSRSNAKLGLFAEMMDELIASASTLSLGALVEKVLDKSGYLEMLKALDETEGKDRTENVKELVSNAVQYDENDAEATLAGFLEEVALVSDVDNYDPEAPAVVMMTVHSSKGLEFPCVFVSGLEENIFPGAQSSMDEEELEEERRLCYVAITRAKKRLFLLHCNSRMMYGKTDFNRRSRFIDEIAEQFCEYEQAYFTRMEQMQSDFVNEYSGYGGFTAPKQINREYIFSQDAPWNKRKKEYEMTTAMPKKTASQPQNSNTFKAGDSVTHPIFGDGFVLSAKNMSNDVMYEVAFDKVGTKKIMGNYAKMSKKS